MLCIGTVRKGWTDARSEIQAVRELHAQIAVDCEGTTFVYCSPNYDLDKIAQALSQVFDNAVIGCTTAGEITPEGYCQHSLTGFSLPSSYAQADHFLIENVAQLDLEGIDAISEQISSRGQEPQASSFGLLLVDGLSVSEEMVIGALQPAMGDLLIVGGSAGDCLEFGRTWLYHDGRFHTNAAIFSHITTSHKFHAFKTQHFDATNTRMIITGARTGKRIVTEINGQPAAEEYARLVGQDVAELDSEVFSRYPVMLKVGGEYYVRAIQQANSDGSLTFYCAIDEGVVLTVGNSLDFCQQLAGALGQVHDHVPDPILIIGFECILRRLEVEAKGLVDEVSRIMAENNVVGFHTYGEQFGAIHVNQTFTGVALGN